MSFESRNGFNKSVWGPFKIVANRLRNAKVEFKHSSDNDDPIQHILEDNVAYEDATAVSSLITKGYAKGEHHPCLDLDIGHVYIPSTNPNHGHLIFTDISMDTEKYLKFLQTLADYGILEQGFVNVAKHRKQSWLRMPWITKQGQELYRP